ncbi:MAG: sodium:solute symporter family protein, partial [Candidatus Dormiibacterota bacterium]
MNAAVSIGIFAFFMLATVALGLASLWGRGRTSLEDWSVGGRNLGSVFIWVLMAGEVYTSFSYLGAAGWGYLYGVPIYYEFAYLACGYGLGYFFGPMLWAYARKHHLVSLSDIAGHRFQSPWLGGAIAVLATIFLLPYIQLEITGMGVVVSTISYGVISLGWGYVIAFVVTEAFVVLSGLRGSAWVSVLKDTLVIATLLVLAIYIPLHYFGGYAQLFQRLIATHPGWLTLPGHDSPGLGEGWFATTGIVNSIGFVVFPTSIASYLGARSGTVLRRNAIFLPFYQLLLFVPMLLGMAALFVVPHLTNSNLALFAMVTQALPAWLVGIVGVAGALSSIVPMAVFMLVIGTMWGRSVLGTSRRTAAYQKPLSQGIAFVAGVVALVLTFVAPSTLVRLSVISYEGIAQFAPIVLVGLLYRRMTTAGALSGLAVGVVVVCLLVFSGHDPLDGVNAGLIGLVLNAAVNFAVSSLRQSDVPL